jgi:predicted ArsR family transcriptional regulator
VRATGGKPAYLYEVAPEAERLFTKAYIPVLTQLVAVLEERVSAHEMRDLLREVGQRLAAARGPSSGSARTRAEAAATVLTELGGVVDVEEGGDGSLTLRGFSCPLADAVLVNPATCQAVESLIAELTGLATTERCDRNGQPRCCFALLNSST